MTELKGKLNRYTCWLCCKAIITRNEDNGVTPFMIECRATPGCRGYGYSSMYMHVTGEPTFIWRKPTPKEYERLSKSEKQHVDEGGLELYPIRSAHH